MKTLLLIINTCFVLLLLSVASLFVVPMLPLESNIEIKIVESGSMEPSIKTGSLVVIVPSSSYKEGDVITFESPSNEVPTTHRIVDVTAESGQSIFTTKGDANEEVDTNPVDEGSIIGRVLIAVPYAGFILDFARQPIGFSLLIVLPALLIIVGEIEKIWSQLRKRKSDNDDGTPTISYEGRGDDKTELNKIVRMIEIGHPIAIQEVIPQAQHLSVVPAVGTHRNLSFKDVVIGCFVGAFCVCFSSLSFIGSTVSYFSDQEISELNTLTAQTLDFIIESDGTAYSFIENELDDEDGALITVTTPTSESADMQYEVSAHVLGESSLFCDSILVDTSLPLEYSGSLVNILGTNVDFDGPWVLSISLPTSYGPFALGETCSIEIVYEASGVGVSTGEGYTDIETITLVFTAPVTTFVPLETSSLLLQPESFAGEIQVEELIQENESSAPELVEPAEDIIEKTVPLEIEDPTSSEEAEIPETLPLQDTEEGVEEQNETEVLSEV